MHLTAPAGRAQTLTAGFLALAMAGTVGTALAFEHIGGFIPCALCLEQRLPYYIGVPVMAAALVASMVKMPGALVRVLLMAGAALMAWGLVLGVYHSGVEWHWWAGPTDCTGVAADMPTTTGDLFASMGKRPPSCDQAAGHFLGLSFPGWNVLSSLFLMMVALWGATRKA